MFYFIIIPILLTKTLWNFVSSYCRFEISTMLSLRQIQWLIVGSLVILLTLRTCKPTVHVAYRGAKAERSALILPHPALLLTNSITEWKNVPGNLQFVEKRHKRALATYIYFHQPIPAVDWSVFSEPVRYRIDHFTLSGRNILIPSLRAPPIAC